MTVDPRAKCTSSDAAHRPIATVAQREGGIGHGDTRRAAFKVVLDQRVDGIIIAHANTSDRERFFAHMSHELRTPVNAVLGYTALLSEGAGGALPPQAAQMVGRISRSAQHLRELVDDLLDISRMEAGKLTLSIDDVPLSPLVREALAFLEPQARAKGLALELRISDVPRLRTDARRVRQILLNLVSNAVKATERGGVTVTLETHSPSSIAVRVADTGAGILADDQERVFEEFVQLGDPNGGTGLGLAVSRRLAWLLGGDLTLRSTPGQGSCFTLTLPSLDPAVDASRWPPSV